MTIRLGNAAAPRWWDLGPDRFLDYLALLDRCGATSAEVVLHHGPSDLEIARVHVLEPDWDHTIRAFQDRGITCHVHAPLDRRFDLAHWATDSERLRADYLPLIEAASSIADSQDSGCVFVVHGAEAIDRDDEVTADFLRWFSAELRSRGDGVGIALELRKPSARSSGFDRDRTSIVSFVESLDDPTMGICWDLGHDWEGRVDDPAWTPRPDDSFLQLVKHVHVHGSAEDGSSVHWPLQSGEVPWREMIEALVESDFDGAVTMEIRYRYAMRAGEPWDMLAGSYQQLSEAISSAGAIPAISARQS